jgi:oxygen-independent coproporphyrinogen-3 oxidase
MNWRAAVTGGHLPVARGVALTADDRLIAAVIERLMCELTVDLDAARRRHDGRPDIFDRAKARLEPFLDDGLATLEGGRLSVTEEGRLVVRSICAAFDPYLDPVAGRHAKAI